MAAAVERDVDRVPERSHPCFSPAVDLLLERLDEVADDPLCGPDVAREAR
jgi:hypothetical protein